MAVASVLTRPGLRRFYATTVVPRCCFHSVARLRQLEVHGHSRAHAIWVSPDVNRATAANARPADGCRWLSDGTTDFRVEPLIRIHSAAVDVVAVDLAGGNARYLDCRSEEEYAGGVIPGSINLPYPHNGNRELIDPGEFLEDVLAEGFHRGEKIYVGCRKGPRSALACEVLSNAGFTCVLNVEGGIQEWVSRGLPIHPFTG